MLAGKDSLRRPWMLDSARTWEDLRNNGRVLVKTIFCGSYLNLIKQKFTHHLRQNIIELDLLEILAITLSQNL